MSTRNPFETRGGSRYKSGRKLKRARTDDGDDDDQPTAQAAILPAPPGVIRPAHDDAPVRSLDDEVEEDDEDGEVHAEPGFFAPELQAHADNAPPPDDEIGDVDENFDDDPALNDTNQVGIVERYLGAAVAVIKRELEKKNGGFYQQVTERGDMLHRPPNPVAALWKKIIKDRKTDVSPDPFYYPDIFVWVPELVFPGFKVNCMKCNREANNHGWSDVRRVIGLHRNYYLLTRRHTCKHCEEDFRPTTPGYIQTLPRHIQFMFPAVLTKRSAIDRLIVEQLDSFVDSGMPSNAIASMIRENHRRFYTETAVQYYSVILDACEFQATQPFGPRIDKKSVARFSGFQDSTGYNGFAPSGMNQ